MEAASCEEEELGDRAERRGNRHVLRLIIPRRLTRLRSVQSRLHTCEVVPVAPSRELLARDGEARVVGHVHAARWRQKVRRIYLGDHRRRRVHERFAQPKHHDCEVGEEAVVGGGVRRGRQPCLVPQLGALEVHVRDGSDPVERGVLRRRRLEQRFEDAERRGGEALRGRPHARLHRLVVVAGRVARVGEEPIADGVGAGCVRMRRADREG